MARSTVAPAWMEALTRAVWVEDGLAESTLPRVHVREPARSTRGFINYARMPFRIVVRRHEDDAVMRSTLLHELAHGVHRMHASDAASCRCEVRCVWDAHGATFKAHLARLEHRHTPGRHSRWGVAGCRGLKRVPAGTPWHAEIPCPAPDEVSSHPERGVEADGVAQPAETQGRLGALLGLGRVWGR